MDSNAKQDSTTTDHVKVTPAELRERMNRIRPPLHLTQTIGELIR